MSKTNAFGVPLHACWGYRHDAHYWTWVASWCGDGSGMRPGCNDYRRCPSVGVG